MLTGLLSYDVKYKNIFSPQQRQTGRWTFDSMAFDSMAMILFVFIHGYVLRLG